MATLVAVLHATTKAFTPCSAIKSTASCTYCLISSFVLRNLELLGVYRELSEEAVASTDHRAVFVARPMRYADLDAPDPSFPAGIGHSHSAEKK